MSTTVHATRSHMTEQDLQAKFNQADQKRLDDIKDQEWNAAARRKEIQQMQQVNTHGSLGRHVDTFA